MLISLLDLESFENYVTLGNWRDLCLGDPLLKRPKGGGEVDEGGKRKEERGKSRKRKMRGKRKRRGGARGGGGGRGGRRGWRRRGRKGEGKRRR